MGFDKHPRPPLPLSLSLFLLFLSAVQDKAGDARPDPNGVSDPVYKMTYFVHALWRRLAQGGLDRPFKAFVFGAFFTEVGEPVGFGGERGSMMMSEFGDGDGNGSEKGAGNESCRVKGNSRA